jgi:acyl carrier protein
MNSQTKIIEIVSDVLDNVEVSSSTARQNTPEWNSLKHMEIIFAIEEEFEIQYSEDEMIAIASVGDIVDSIARKQS